MPLSTQRCRRVNIGGLTPRRGPGNTLSFHPMASRGSRTIRMTFAHVWHLAFVAAPAEGSSLNPAVGLLCAAAVVALGLALARLRQQKRQIAALRRQVTEQ